MKARNVTVVSVEAECGKCGKALTDPNTGSFLLSTLQWFNAAIKCECGGINWMPASICKFVGK